MSQMVMFVVILALVFPQVAGAETSIELPKLPNCGKMNTLNNLSQKSVWASPGRKILGKPTEAWTSSDFAAAKEYAKGCLQQNCEKSQSWCETYKKAVYDNIANTLEKAPEWAKEAQKKVESLIAENEAVERSMELEQKLTQKLTIENVENAIRFFEQSIKETKSLPDTKESIIRLDAIKEEGGRLGPALWNNDAYGHLDDELDLALREKRQAIESVVARTQCAAKMPKTGLPKEIYSKSIWGIYANAVQFKINFEMVFCSILNKGNSAKYVPPPRDTSNYGIEIRNDIATIVLIFAKLPNGDAWILRDTIVNGRKQLLSQRDAIQLLLGLIS
ncbi:MAG: hypothetical protein ABL983_08055 [Nitrospira sp.]